MRESLEADYDRALDHWSIFSFCAFIAFNVFFRNEEFLDQVRLAVAGFMVR